MRSAVTKEKDMARHHASKRARKKEHMGMEKYERGPVRHHAASTIGHSDDHFNDEYKHDRESEPYGRYIYDREDPVAARGMEQSFHRRAMLDGREHYAGMEPRRRQEMADAGMIHEDQRQIANLPQQVVIEPYPYERGYMPEDLDDTLRGIDRQKNYDNSKKFQHLYPKKV